MSNPDKQSATQSKEPTFVEQVNEAVNSVEVNDNGELVFAEGTSEAVQYAATLEKRRRDTQAEYTKGQQKLAALTAEKTELETMVRGNVKLDLTEEQTEELEDLKFSDPEAWRNKMNAYENEARAKHNQLLDEKLKEVSSKGSAETELEQRKRLLTEFSANSGIEITDDILANDVPPRITRELDEGKVTFEQFLDKVASYLTNGKVIKDTEAANLKDLGKEAGGDSAYDVEGGEQKPKLDYKTVTF